MTLTPSRSCATPASAPSLGEYIGLLGALGRTVLCTDMSGRLTYISSGWQELTGLSREESTGMRLHDLVRADEARRLVRSFNALLAGDDSVSCLELHTTHRDGCQRTVEAVVHARYDRGGRPCGAVATLSDVTEERENELTLRHSQKLESVGRLAAGIAHEINTPIQFVGDNLHFLSESFERVTELLDRYRSALNGDAGELSWADRQQMLLDAESQADLAFVVEEVPEAVDAALDGVKRVASIVRAMKAFGHPDQTEKQAVDLNEVLRNTLVVARNEIKYVAKVEANLGDVPVINGHPGDLGQVFLNLLVNAADAVADVVGQSGDLGRIQVRTTSNGDEVLVTVEDSGHGIPESIAAHVFEPFFTTKAVGRGTGQGLSLARAIVERHGGRLGFKPGVEGGTCFSVALPVHQEAS